MNNAIGFEGVQAFAFVQIPQHGGGVFTTGGTEGTVGGDGDGVQVTGVAFQIVAEFAIGQVPDFDKVVPTATDNEGVGGGGGEADAGDPFGVSFVGDGVFAFAQGVP